MQKLGYQIIILKKYIRQIQKKKYYYHYFFVKSNRHKSNAARRNSCSLSYVTHSQRVCGVGSYIGGMELGPLIGISGAQMYVALYATHDRQGYESTNR